MGVLEFINTNTASGSFSLLTNSTVSEDDKQCFALYIKDKFSLSDEAYHEMSMLSQSLPRSIRLKDLVRQLNTKCNIVPAPNGGGVQQSLASQVLLRLQEMFVDRSVESKFASGKHVRIKLSGVMELDGGDMKFLLLLYGLDAANAQHSCLWRKCPASERWDMAKQWSFSDLSKGAKTIEELQRLSKLPKSRNKERFNCSRQPLFPCIPIDHVVIDNIFTYH